MISLICTFIISQHWKKLKYYKSSTSTTYSMHISSCHCSICAYTVSLLQPGSVLCLVKYIYKTTLVCFKKNTQKKPLHYFFHDTAKLSFEHRDHVACCATSQFHISGKRGQKMNGSITSLLFHAPCTGPAERSASSPWVLSDWGRQFLGTKAPGQYAM